MTTTTILAGIPARNVSKNTWVCTCVCMHRKDLVAWPGSWPWRRGHINNNCGKVLHDDVACPNMASATWIPVQMSTGGGPLLPFGDGISSLCYGRLLLISSVSMALTMWRAKPCTLHSISQWLECADRAFSWPDYVGDSQICCTFSTACRRSIEVGWSLKKQLNFLKCQSLGMLRGQQWPFCRERGAAHLFLTSGENTRSTHNKQTYTIAIAIPKCTNILSNLCKTKVQCTCFVCFAPRQNHRRKNVSWVKSWKSLKYVCFVFVSGKDNWKYWCLISNDELGSIIIYCLSLTTHVQWWLQTSLLKITNCRRSKLLCWRHHHASEIQRCILWRILQIFNFSDVMTLCLPWSDVMFWCYFPLYFQYGHT
jgi:hypothetical protein